jgi:ParB-like chromosome segregation protein Spo0J
MHADQLTAVEVGRLKLHPKNARRGDVDAIAASLERFGQVKPLIVQRSTGYVVAGNHTLQAAQKLGWSEVSILVKDLSDEEATAYLIADNRTADKATYDDEALYELLGGLDLTGTGYDDEAVGLLADAVAVREIEDDFGDPEYSAPGRKAPEPGDDRSKKEPLRDLVLMMPASQADTFGEQIKTLQSRWGTRTVVDTVRRAVHEAVHGTTVVDA